MASSNLKASAPFRCHGHDTTYTRKRTLECNFRVIDKIYAICLQVSSIVIDSHRFWTLLPQQYCIIADAFNLDPVFLTPIQSEDSNAPSSAIMSSFGKCFVRETVRLEICSRPPFNSKRYPHWAKAGDLIYRQCTHSGRRSASIRKKNPWTSTA